MNADPTTLVTACRWSTVALLSLMFAAIFVGMVTGLLDLRRLEAKFSLAARCVIGLALLLGQARALSRPFVIVPGDDSGMTIVIVALISVGSLWMLLASLPLAQWSAPSRAEDR